MNTRQVAKGDRAFFAISTAAAMFTMFLVLAVLVFLSIKSWSTFTQQGLAFVTGSTWDNTTELGTFQIWPMLYGSFLNALLAIIFAVPISVLLAIFIVFIAPKKIARALTIAVDVLAAIPSGIIGIWGFLVFTPVAEGWARLIHQYLGSIPIFVNNQDQFTRSPFITAWVLGIMIVPIITVVAREVLAQTPQDLLDAARGLGGSLWGTVRMVALPHARGGIVGGVMLGLGRALGETVAIYFVLNLIFERVNYYRILDPEGGSVASMIIAKFGEATPEEIQALLGAGLVLFILTLVVNLIANWIVARSARERLV
jgi:phosphate transport system permease protein